MHNLKSLINQGLKERSTWIGIALLIFGWMYHHEIHILIKNVLTSMSLSEHIVDGLATLVAFLFILYKHKNHED